MKNLLKAKRVIWLIIFALVTAVSCLSYFAGKRYLATVESVEQTLAVRTAIDGVLSLVKDAETGQRGFLLSGDEQFLDPYRFALAGLPQQFTDLRRVTGSDPKQSQRLRKLELLVAEKEAYMADTLRLRREGDVTTTIGVVRSGRGKLLMDQIRLVCAAMRGHEQSILTERRQAAAGAQRVATWGVGSGALLTLFLALISLLTVNRDVEDLRRTADQLAASEEHYRFLTESSTDLVRLIDGKGRVTYVSPSVEHLLGYGVEEFLAIAPYHLLHPDEVEISRRILAEVRSGRLSSDVNTYRLRHKDGSYRDFEVRWSAHRTETGEITSIHTTGRDVTERLLGEQLLSTQAEQLRTLSLRDELTGLYNRRGFLEIAAQAQAQAWSAGRGTALVFVDLNGMKRINDELGHDHGDLALKDAAEVLGAAMSEGDVIARLGGDEFVAFSVDFSEARLLGLRQRVRSLADAQTSRFERRYRLSMSVGAAFDEPTCQRSLTELLERADAAMYEQKRLRHAAGGVSLLPPPERSTG